MDRQVLLKVVTDGFVRSGIRWGLLHEPPPNLGEGQSKADVDLAANLSAPEILRLCWESLVPHGVIPFMLVQTDVGGAYAFWVYDQEDAVILEFDVLADPRGIGRLGIPTDLALADLRPSFRWRLRIVALPWSSAYIVSKRLWKREWERLSEVDMSQLDLDLLQGALCEVFGGQAGRLAVRLLRKGAGPTAWKAALPILSVGRRQRRWRRSFRSGSFLPRLAAQRVHARLVAPVGFWVHVVGPYTEARAFGAGIHDRLGSALHRTAFLHVEGSRGQGWYLRHIAPIIIRPGLAVTWSIDDVIWRGAKPGLVLEGPTSEVVDDALRPIISKMAQRLYARLVGLRPS